MFKSITLIAAGALLSFGMTQKAQAHCEVPCGIYADDLRLQTIAEDITTIEKAMKKIVELSASKTPNHNQIVRWVSNKEKHAENIQKIAYQYFMTQRVKFPKADDVKAKAAYTKKLELLHQILVYSMKAKQGTDLKNVKSLRASLAAFSATYACKAHTH